MNGLAVKAASEKQLKFVRDLMADRDTEAFIAGLPEAWHDTYEGIRADTLDFYAGPDVSKFIDALLKLPKVPIKTFQQESVMSPIAKTDGMYKKGDTFYKLKFTKANKLWAHRLRVHEHTGGQVRVSFKYAGSPNYLGITDKMKLTYEEAKAFGALYGSCISCGRLLTNELSIALGIGPICGEREFGGTFKFMLDKAKLDLEAK